jgi:hypothetical protein
MLLCRMSPSFRELSLLGSDNPYLSDMIDSGQALTVRIMLPTGMLTFYPSELH